MGVAKLHIQSAALPKTHNNKKISNTERNTNDIKRKHGPAYEVFIRNILLFLNINLKKYEHTSEDLTVFFMIVNLFL